MGSVFEEVNVEVTLIYASLYSAKIFDVIFDSLFTNKSVSASGGVLGR